MFESPKNILLLKFAAFAKNLEDILEETCGVQFISTTQFESNDEEGESFETWIKNQIQKASKVVCLFPSSADLNEALSSTREDETSASEQQSEDRLRMAFHMVSNDFPMKLVAGVLSGCAATNHSFPVFKLPEELFNLAQELGDHSAQDNALRMSIKKSWEKFERQESLRLLEDDKLGIAIDLDLLQDMYDASVPIWD